MWTCSACSLENEDREKKCTTCGTEQISDFLQNVHSLRLDEGALYPPPDQQEAPPQPVPDQQPPDGAACAVGGEPVYNAPSTISKDEEVRIVLLGRTGSGKSASGNTILDKKEFPSKLSATAVTKESKRGTCTRFERCLQVIDTPGLFDTEMKTEDITREVIKCVGMTAPGPHAFILVIKVDKFTVEELNTVEYFMKLFGTGMLDYLIILFTKKDELINDGQTIEDYIGGDSSTLRSKLDDCGGRYVTFNNRGSVTEKEQDVQTLLSVIDQMVQNNRGKVYTNDMFQEAERAMQEKEAELRGEHEKAGEDKRDFREEARREVEKNSRFLQRALSVLKTVPVLIGAGLVILLALAAR